MSDQLTRHQPDSSELGWLAGVIDSEGTVALVSGRAACPTLRIHIYNSDELILDKCATILYDLGIPWSERKDSRHERPGYALSISTAGCILAYEHLRPYMVRQASRYDAGYWFMESRVKPGRRRIWTDQDKAVWQNLRAVLNAR